MPKIKVQDIKLAKAGEQTISLKENLSRRRYRPKRYLDLENRFPVANHMTRIQDLSNSVSPAQTEKYLYLPEHNNHSKQQSTFWDLIRFTAAGLIIVILLNLINAVQSGKNLSREIASAADQGYQNLLSGAGNAQQSNFQKSKDAFTDAEKSFSSALSELQFLQSNVNAPAYQQTAVAAVPNLLRVAQNLATAGQEFSTAATQLRELPQLFLQINQAALTSFSSDPNTKPITPSFTDQLEQAFNHLNKAKQSLNQAEQLLLEADLSFLPDHLKSQLHSLKNSLAELNQLLDRFQQLAPNLLNLLGHRYPHRYLILLQNDDESRPTGGFIGSLLIFDLNDGQLQNLQFRDVYDYDGQITADITPPPEIAQISQFWKLRDSNYSPDFAVSAAKTAWFLEQAKGPGVDTVIAINLSVAEDLLAELPPLQIEGVKGKVSAAEFATLLTYLVEVKHFGQNTPKTVVASAIKSFLSALSAQPDWTGTLAAFKSAIQTRKLLFFSKDLELQKMFESYNLAGHLPQFTTEKSDYLNLVNVSIGGNKSDRYIRQSVKQNTFLQSDGTIINELTIVRSHTWTEQTQKSIISTLQKFGVENPSENFLRILGAGINRTFIRVYVPLGSQLENVLGVLADQVTVQHDPDLQKTYFLVDLSTAPGEESGFTIRYQLPFKLDNLAANIYRLQLIPPVSAHDISFTQHFHLPAGSQILRTNFPTTAKAYETSYSFNWQTPVYSSVVITK